MEAKQIVDQLLAGGDIRKAIMESGALTEGVSLMALAKWLLGQCDMSVEAEMPQEEHIASIVDALQHTPEVIKYYMQNAMENKPVYESVNSDDLRVALFLQSVDGLIGAFMSVQSAWEDLEKEYPEFANIAAQKYPFKKSFDEIPL